MPSTKDLDTMTGLKIQLNGKPGAGKTGMAGSFFRAGKIKFFDFDGKLEILKNLYPTADIEYDSYGADNYNKFLNDWESLQTSCPYKTIVVDSFTALSNTCVVFQLMTKGKMGKMTKGGVQVTGYEEINGETALVTKMLEIMKICVSKFRTNFIWTTHPVARIEGTGEDSKKVSTIAAYGFKVPSIVPAYFNEIYNIKMVKKDMEGKIFKRVAFTTFCTDDDSVRSVIQLPNEIDLSDFDLYGKIQTHLGQRK
jgi:hypothetical protein